MVKAQTWLDSHEHYNTKEKRAAVRELCINEQLEGEFDLADFTYSWLGVYIYPEVDESKFEIKNKSEYAQLIKLINTQAYLDKEYPLSGRNEATELAISDENLTGELVLVGFSNLTTLNCWNNKLTNLDLTGCSVLTMLNCSNNKLTNLDLTGCSVLTMLSCRNNQLTNYDFLHQVNPDKLKVLDIDNNNLAESDLSVLGQILSKSINLEKLWIGSNDQEKINQGSYNRFSGSLTSLQTLTKLKVLDIRNTDIDSGWEYLPDSLNTFYCSTKERPASLVNRLAQGLRVYGEPTIDYNGDNYVHLLKLQNQAQWIKLGFSKQEIKEWINIGLKYNEWGFVDCLQQRGYTSNTINVNNIPKLRNDAQIWVNLEYPLSIRKNIKELDLSNKNLTGFLNLENFTNLETLDCSNNQLTNLDLNHCANLKELDCSNNQLVDINFPPDAILLEKVNIEGNEHLNYEQIDSKFLKYLPTLTKHEIKAISKEKFTNLIKEKLANVDIQEIDIFPTWWNPNCALVTSKVVKYAIRLVIYEPTFGNSSEIIFTKRFPDLNLLSGYKTFARIKEKISELKTQLNSDNPILVIYNDTNFSPREVIKKFELSEAAKANPNQYLRATDMVWREMEGKVSSALNAITDVKHVAVYLGNKRVAHIGSSKFAKLGSSLNPSNPSSNKAFMGARNDHWNDFLGGTSKLFRYHLIIPFQRPEIIQERLTKAIVGGYGEKEYNFLKENCEHFATLCVTGIPFSTQIDKLLITNHFGRLINSKSLLTAIKNSDIIINAKVTDKQLQAAKDKFLANRQARITVLTSKIQKTAEDKQLLSQFQFEIASLTETATAQIQIPLNN